MNVNRILHLITEISLQQSNHVKFSSYLVLLIRIRRTPVWGRGSRTFGFHRRCIYVVVHRLVTVATKNTLSSVFLQTIMVPCSLPQCCCYFSSLRFNKINNNQAIRYNWIPKQKATQWLQGGLDQNCRLFPLIFTRRNPKDRSPKATGPSHGQNHPRLW